MKDKRRTLDKRYNSLETQKIRKSQQIKERGITLIALVVTVIILLILAGVTLNIALSDNGLFSKTKKATEDYKQAQSEEEEAIRQISTQFYSDYVGAKVTGYSPKTDTVKIEGTTSGVDSKTDSNGKQLEGVADDFSQTFTTKEISWRVWDYDGNTLRIIGDPTTDALTLKGAAGYNNGVWAIDNICRTLYSNEEKGAIATNLKRTDIQKVSTYDYTKYKHKESGDNTWEEITTNSNDENLIYFGESKTYEASNQYPAMWNENDKEWTYEYSKDNGSSGEDKECKKWEEIGTKDGKMEGTMNQKSKETTFKESYYYHNYKESEFINGAYYDLIFKESNDGQPAKEYWLAGRYVQRLNNCWNFGLQCVGADGSNYNYVSGHNMCFSDR